MGILARNATVRIDSVTITGTTRAAVDLTVDTDTLAEVTLQHSVLSNNAGTGVITRGDTRRFHLLNNEIRSNGIAGVVLMSEATLDLRGNTILENGAVGIEIRLDTTLARLRRTNTLSENDVRIVGMDDNPY